MKSGRKTGVALRANLRAMGEGRKWLYLWTFTLEAVIPVKTACSAWKSFLRDVLVRRFGFAGYRVFELHPKGHGLHVHFVTTKRISVVALRDAMEDLKAAVGWGRIHVVRIPSQMADYVAKYLRKGQRCGAFAGVRIWAAVRMGKARVLVSDIECNTILSRLVKLMRRRFTSWCEDFSTNHVQQYRAYQAALWEYALGHDSTDYKGVLLEMGPLCCGQS